MQNIFSKFIDEVDLKDNINLEIKKQNSPFEKTVDQTSGELLIGGCIDWENATSSNPSGLDQIHHVKLTNKVIQTFSSSSSMHEFILLDDQTVYAMGRNERGQLGTGDTTTQKFPIAINLPLHSKIKKISTGRSHSLLLYENGELYGVGANNFGQLGLGASKTAVKDTLKFTKINFPKKILDISCGYDFSVFCDIDGECYTFGHSEYGQLGHGTDGQYIASGKGPSIQYSCVYTPQRIETYVCKDHHNKITNEIKFHSIYIKAVAAGKNHVLALEEWEHDNDDNNSNRSRNHLNRVFSWGFGGYGRLGHNSSNNEFIPREIIPFSNYSNVNNQKQQILHVNKQKQIRSIIAGSSYSLGISESKHLYYWGKMSNAPRGEATIYPQIQSELFDYPVKSCAAGSNLIIVITNNETSNNHNSSHNSCIGWGVPIAGKIGFEGDSKTSTNPKFLSIFNNLHLLHITCGYGHISIIVNEINNNNNNNNNNETNKKIQSFPIFNNISNNNSNSTVKYSKKSNLQNDIDSHKIIKKMKK